MLSKVLRSWGPSALSLRSLLVMLKTHEEVTEAAHAQMKDTRDQRFLPIMCNHD